MVLPVCPAGISLSQCLAVGDYFLGSVLAANAATPAGQQLLELACGWSEMRTSQFSGHFYTLKRVEGFFIPILSYFEVYITEINAHSFFEYIPDTYLIDMSCVFIQRDTF